MKNKLWFATADSLFIASSDISSTPALPQSMKHQTAPYQINCVFGHVTVHRWVKMVLSSAACKLCKNLFFIVPFFFLRMRRIYRDFFFPSRVAVWEHFILFCLNLNLLVRVQLWYRTHSSPFQKLKTNRKLMPKWDMIQSLFNFMVGCG